MLVKIVGYVFFPLLMSLLGLHLASKAETGASKVLYRIIFVICFVFSIGLSIKSEYDADHAHQKELSDAEKRYEVLKKSDDELRQGNVELQKNNSYMNGKFDTMATVLGSIAKRGADTSDIAKALALSAKSQTSNSVTKTDEDREQEARNAIAKVYGEGERLRAVCQKNGTENHDIGDQKPFDTWISDANQAIVAYIDPRQADWLNMQYPAGSGSLSKFCWNFIMKVNDFENVVKQARDRSQQH